jgi:hypothetical protein
MEQKRDKSYPYYQEHYRMQETQQKMRTVSLDQDACGVGRACR